MVTASGLVITLGRSTLKKTNDLLSQTKLTSFAILDFCGTLRIMTKVKIACPALATAATVLRNRSRIKKRAPKKIEPDRAAAMNCLFTAVRFVCMLLILAASEGHAAEFATDSAGATRVL